MGRKILCFSLVCALIFGVFSVGYCQKNSLSKKEIERIVGEVARKRGIPSVILKSVAKTESSFTQFTPSGKIYASRGGNIGIMQVRSNAYNLKKLQEDPVYNIEAGADVLLAKWKYANSKMPQIGNMDPNILEHWYFALWAYNGLLNRNNPNQSSNTYQDKIYKTAQKIYGVKISSIDKKSLPKKGIPGKNIKLETPAKFHEGDIIKYKIGDIVLADGKEQLLLLNQPSGKEVGRVDDKTKLTIIEGPKLKNGFYFYKVKNKEKNKEGWIYGNWIKVVNKSS